MLYFCGMMQKSFLAGFRASLGMSQAEFGQWLAQRLERERAYTGSEVSNWETGARGIPFAVQAVTYKHLYETGAQPSQ